MHNLLYNAMLIPIFLQARGVYNGFCTKIMKEENSPDKPGYRNSVPVFWKHPILDPLILDKTSLVT